MTHQQIQSKKPAQTSSNAMCRQWQSDKPLSEIHIELHRENLSMAHRLEKRDRAAAFRMLELAKISRYYFAHLRTIGE